jgi:hypothetical protein
MLIDRFFLKGQQPNANLRARIVEPSTIESPLMTIDIDHITGAGIPGHPGNVTPIHPQMTLREALTPLWAQQHAACRFVFRHTESSRLILVLHNGE